MSNVLPDGVVKPRLKGMAKVRRLFQEDSAGLHLRLQLANMVARLLPIDMASRLRGELLNRAGFKVGAGTIIRGRPHINGKRHLYKNLSVGHNCLIDVGCTLDLEDRITIGNRVTIGHEVMLLTSSHEIGPKEGRAGPVVLGPIVIEDGAWIGPRAVVLPGVTIGAGAMVTAGALVNKNVPPNVRVAGTPAKQVEELPDD
ncbi:MAG: acyltransferase [Oscillochloris sp.]|nr:acyltransferase [Oscillochloris sp.]